MNIFVVVMGGGYALAALEAPAQLAAQATYTLHNQQKAPPCSLDVTGLTLRPLPPGCGPHILLCSSYFGAGATRGLDVTGLTLRGFTYQAVGQLAQRQPQAFAGRTDIAARCVTEACTALWAHRVAPNPSLQVLCSLMAGWSERLS